jgi:hypothetical protein
MNDIIDRNTKEVTGSSKLLDEQQINFLTEKVDSTIGEKLKSRNTYHDYISVNISFQKCHVLIVQLYKYEIF